MVNGAMMRSVQNPKTDANGNSFIQYPTSIQFFYSCKVPPIDDGRIQQVVKPMPVILRCNPCWQGDSTVSSRRRWFDWVEVSWTLEDESSNTVPAILCLWGKVHFQDGTSQFLAVVRSLISVGPVPIHDRMFFARGDYLDMSPAGLHVMEFESISTTAFVFPSLPPISDLATPAKDSVLKTIKASNYYAALPARSEWVYLGWDQKLVAESNSKGMDDGYHSK
jgi:hypothetical protein